MRAGNSQWEDNACAPHVSGPQTVSRLQMETPQPVPPEGSKTAGTPPLSKLSSQDIESRQKGNLLGFTDDPQQCLSKRMQVR